MQQYKRHWIFLTLLLIGLIVRLIFISEQGLSNDELSAWYRTRFSSWESFWNLGVKSGDMHPAFYQVLLWIWVRVFGDSEFIIRATSLLFYILNSYLIYKISCKHFTMLGGLLLQGLYVSLTFTIINTVFARPYNSGTFFLLIAFWAVLELKLSVQQKWKWVFLLSLGLWGAMVSHYFAFLVAIILGICSLFYLGKRNLKYLIIAGLISVISFLPHLSITLFQTGRGGLGWLAAPKLTWPIDFLHQFFNESWVLMFGFIFLFIITLIFFGFNKWTVKSTFSLSIFLLAYVFAFVLSHFFTPILRDLVMMFLLPFVFLPLFSMIKVESKKWSLLLITIVTLVPLADSFLRNQLLEPVHYGVFKEIGQEINKANDKYGRDKITFASNFNNVDYINYYVEQNLEESIINWDDHEAVYTLAERAKNSKSAYFCYSFSNKYHTPMFLEVIRNQFPGKEAKMTTRFSSFYLFNKSKKRQLNVPFSLAAVKDTTISRNEFFNEIILNVGQLPMPKNKDGYYLIKTKGLLKDSVPFFIVIAAERDGEMIMNGENPLFYVAFDQSRLNIIGIEQDFFIAFNLPETIRPTDVLKLYCWNPSKVEVKTSDFRFYLVDEKDKKIE